MQRTSNILNNNNNTGCQLGSGTGGSLQSGEIFFQPIAVEYLGPMNIAAYSFWLS